MAMSNLSNGEVPVVSGQVLPCIDDLLSGGSFFSNDFVNGGAGGGVQPHQGHRGLTNGSYVLEWPDVAQVSPHREMNGSGENSYSEESTSHSEPSPAASTPLPLTPNSWTPQSPEGTTFQFPDVRRNSEPTDLGMLCPVCRTNEAKKGHNHYGARVCQSCRTFFRRSVLSENYKRVVCSPLKGCGDARSWRTCRLCRFKRCLAAGMRPSYVIPPEEQEMRRRSRVMVRSPDDLSFELEKEIVRHTFTTFMNSNAKKFLTFFRHNPETFKESTECVFDCRAFGFQGLMDMKEQNLTSLADEMGAFLDRFVTDSNNGSGIDPCNKDILLSHNLPVIHSFDVAIALGTDNAYFREMVKYGFQIWLNSRLTRFELLHVQNLIQYFSLDDAVSANGARDYYANLFASSKTTASPPPAPAPATAPDPPDEDGVVTNGVDLNDRAGISYAIANSNLDYNRLFASPWTASERQELRHREVTMTIVEWAKKNVHEISDSIEDIAIMHGLMFFIMLFSVDFVPGLRNPAAIERQQSRFCNLLYKYLKTRVGSDKARTLLGEAILMTSHAREITEIEFNRFA